MALYVHKLKENPAPGIRATFVGEHEPRDGEAKKRSVEYAVLTDLGLMRTSCALSPSFAEGIAKQFQSLLDSDRAKDPQ